MKKKIFLIAVFILIGFIYIQNRSSETAHLNKAWEKTMNASSGRITYTVKIIDHGPDFGKTENTITIIDFMEKDDKFFYETVAGAYPEISEDIRNIAALSSQYASSIVDSSKSCEDIQNIAKSYYDIYFRLTDYFGMDGHYTTEMPEDFKSDIDRDLRASEMFS